MNAVEYHEATSHLRDRLSGRRMDSATQPAQFKAYPRDLERISMPRENAFPTMTMPEALASPEALSQPLTMDRLARVLSLTCGLTASAGRIYLRSNPSAGALYPVETYVAVPGGEDDPGGVFHYDPGDHALTRIRRGDGAAYAASACRLPEGAGSPAAVFLFTTIYHRTAWKYGDRGYRYVLLDAGHVMENLLLACRAEHLGAACVTDFADDAVNSLLGVDAER
ncbi:MAG: SagB/ThcOx family dehydrogenase, partial [Oceanidesulfovibrio sp.]